MPTPKITRASRYYARGVSKCYWLPAVASATLVPTRAEMSAGKDLSDDVTTLSGWTQSGNDIDVPTLGSRYTEKHPGAIEAADSSLNLLASKDGMDSRVLMPQDQEGFIMWCDGGDVAGGIGAVYPVRVRSCSLQRSMASEVDQIQHQFSITRRPNDSVTIPTAA